MHRQRTNRENVDIHDTSAFVACAQELEKRGLTHTHTHSHTLNLTRPTSVPSHLAFVK